MKIKSGLERIEITGYLECYQDDDMEDLWIDIIDEETDEYLADTLNDLKVTEGTRVRVTLVVEEDGDDDL